METTRENYDEVREVTEAYVIEQLNQYLFEGGSAFGITMDNKTHIIHIGVSILETKYPQIGMYPGGGFVKAVVNNDLRLTFNNADNINKNFINFYLMLMYNFSIYNLPYKNKD